jgi:hypothetical protein
MFKYISLTKGMRCIVDDDDYERLIEMPWRYNNNGYAITAKTPNPKAMHHFILTIPDDMVADHINGDRLDNRKSNLRVCTKEENSKNRKKRKTSKSPYKGISWNSRDKKWQARIWVEGKNKSAGNYSDPIEAAIAYDLAAIKHYGNFAKTNFISTGV